MTDAVMKFIMLVETSFPRPKFAGDEAREALWMRQMRSLLGGFDEATLTAAADTIVRTRRRDRDGSIFPEPAVCIEYCERAKRDLNHQKTPLLPKQEKADDWSNDRLNLAFDLVNCEMGKRAAREGWIGELYHFARKNMRLPQAHEVPALVAGSRETERIIRDLDKGSATAITAALRTMGRTVLGRRDELADGVLHGVVAKTSWFARG